MVGLTLDEHLELAKKSAKEWHKKNDKPKSNRKALQWIKIQKERRGIA